MNDAAPVLELTDVAVAYRQNDGWVEVVRDVNLRVAAGQVYGLVGESGSGKSTLALAVLRALPANGRVQHGSIRLAGQDIDQLDQSALRTLRRQRVKLVPQSPQSALNPSLRIGAQMAEGLPDASAGEEGVLALLEQVHIPDPRRVARSYPHELSGGMLQRVLIALALAPGPELLLLDEPTTALDATTEAAILDLIRELIAARNMAVLFVTHNLGIVARMCDRVAVLYAGEQVEDATTPDLFRRPLHPYTRGLLDSVPRAGQTKQAAPLRPIPGRIPPPSARPSGCVFAPRCPIAIAKCAERPELTAVNGRGVRCHRWQEIAAGQVNAHSAINAPAPRVARAPGDETALAVEHAEVHFPLRRSLRQWLRRTPASTVRAVDGVSLETRRGQIVGLVGESGSGKTTLARAVVGLSPRTGGEMALLSVALPPRLRERERAQLRQLQMVFQNPDEALNPYLTVGEALRRPLMRLGGLSRAAADARVAGLLQAVKLDPGYASRLPRELSGGEKQRVAIARALATEPDLLLLDEPVSALDVSVQAAILNLLAELQADNENSLLIISHDLAVVTYLADVIAVIYLGHLVEVGPASAVFAPPHHPYTEALLSAIPVPDPAAPGKPIRLAGEIPSPRAIPGGCRFHTRCPRVLGPICASEEPPWQDVGGGHRIYCHIPPAELERLQREAG